MTTRLIQGDALAVLRDLPTSSVDAVITDPPYSSGGQFRGDRTNKSTVAKYSDSKFSGALLPEFSGDNRDQRGYAYWSALWLGEALRIAKPGAVVLLFTDWRQLPTTSDGLQAGGWVWRGIIPWHKPNARVFAGRYTNACEYVVWGSNGALPSPLDGGEGFPGFFQASSPREREHAAQKPLAVMRGLLSPLRGGTVLDPFMGSGTTGIAAVLEGCDFIGIELAEHYYRVAEQRIGAAQLDYREDALQFDLGVEAV